MDKISKNINKMFETLFKNEDKMHPIFKDLKRVYKLSVDYRKQMADSIKDTTKYNKIKTIPEDIIKKPIYDELKKIDLIKMDKEMNNVLNYSKILNLVSYISQFMIKTTVSSKDKLYKNISNNKTDKINIMIIGSGPVGLFLACYLSLYYNDTHMTNSPKANIVMYDSRIEKPGFRKPYNRQRMFSTASKYLSLILPKVYCWDDSKDYLMINIFMLEYMLFTVANLHYHIPMIFEDYSWDDYKNIIDEGKFDVIFDCTGGKLHHDAIKNINTNWLKNMKLYNDQIDKQLNIDINKNLVLLNHDSKHIINYFYGSITLYYNNDTLTFYQKFDFDVMNKKDLMYLNMIKNKYFDHENTIKLIKGISDDNTRNFLYTMIHNDYNNYLFSFDVWGIYIRHAIKISDVFLVNKRKVLFIGAGDTIFHSHFITGAGLNRILDFTVKCANMIGTL